MVSEPKLISSLVWLAIVAVPSVGATEPWAHLANRHGMELERRAVAGSELAEVRVSTHTDLSAAAVAAATWADRFDGKLTKKIRLHWEIVSETQSERVQYVQVRVPVVRNRDYTLRLRRSFDEHGVFHLETEAIPERPPQPGFVRIPHARGIWTVTPTADGGCDVVYVAWAEPGGMVPAFVIRSAQVDSALDLVQEVLDWARTH